MAYVDGFVAAVPAADKDAFRKHAEQAAALSREFGASRHVETWGDDVPEGKVTDFRRAVQAREDEVVVFSWLEYPDKAARDACMARMRDDPRPAAVAMPFDGARVIYGGFTPIVDQGTAGEGGYVDGFLVPVPAANKDAYRDLAARAAEVFRKHGALRVMEAWGDDVPDGKVTDLKRAVKADGDAVVFSWIEWPSKAVRDEGWTKTMADPLMQDGSNPPFDGGRMVYGGFELVLDV